MGFWSRIFGSNSDSQQSTSDEEQIKNRMKSHPDYERLKEMAGGDDMVDIIAKVVADNKKKK